MPVVSGLHVLQKNKHNIYTIDTTFIAPSSSQTYLHCFLDTGLISLCVVRRVSRAGDSLIAIAMLLRCDAVMLV